MGQQENSGLAPSFQEKKKRQHKKYIPSINQSALKELEGATTSSFVDLAEAVILIDGVPYDAEYLPMSKARKIDFERLISHYAQIEIYGKRKYHIKSVFNRVQKEIFNDVELKIRKKEPYTKAQPLTDAQKQARRLLYKAKKEKAQREQEAKDAKILDSAKEKVIKMNEVKEAKEIENV
ncbi:MAG: hypothetical protein FWF81_14480 [Defluviitaleaceae bacterium]|nr:hypothetical protein [Defluviitaleaceae bacterium]